MEIDVVYTKKTLRQLARKMQKCMKVNREQMTLFIIKQAVRASERRAATPQQKVG